MRWGSLGYLGNDIKQLPTPCASLQPTDKGNTLIPHAQIIFPGMNIKISNNQNKMIEIVEIIIKTGLKQMFKDVINVQSKPDRIL